MLDSAAMSDAPPSAAVIDALNSLLEAEQNSIFRFMGEGSPYLNRASAETRRPLQQMVKTSYRHCGQLYQMIEHLGGVPRPCGIEPEEQYLAFLSLKFLLPKLVDAKKMLIERYENAIRALKGADRQALAVVQSLLLEHKSQMAILNRAAEHVAAGK